MLSEEVPQVLIEQIKDHIRQKSINGENGWEHANQEEDTLTGDFLGQLRTDIKSVGNWKWRIRYSKFRGRGKGAYEKIVGADGIITIEIDNFGNRKTKSIIFQAKKKGNRETSEQLAKMQDILPEGNMILIFSSDGYFGETGSSYSNNIEPKTRIGDYLTDVFVDCKNGSWGVEYDMKKHELKIPNKKNPILKINHKLSIVIQN